MKSILLVCGLLISGLSLQAQKFGYVNSAALLEEMPEVKEAEANLETLQKQLQAKGQKMVQEFQAKYDDLQRRHDEGGIAPKDLEVEAQKLKDEQDSIGKYQQDMQQQVMDKRQQLLQPILDRVNAAIKEFAEQGGYLYIFDSSAGILLYADDATDVTDEIKAKLGM